MDEIHEKIHTMQEVQEKQREDCGEFQKALYTLIEAQKNTTRNVDALAQDVKGVLKSSMHFELLEKKLEMTNTRINKLEGNNFEIVKKDIDVMQKKLDKIDIKAVEANIKTDNEKIKLLEDSKTWGFRLIVGAVILGVIGLFFDLKLHSMIGG